MNRQSIERLTLNEKLSLYNSKKYLLKEVPDFIENYENSFIIQYTWDSTAIEGNTLTLHETKMLLEDGITPGQKSLREVFEQVNHRKAFDYMIGRLRAGEELNEDIVLSIHRMIVENIRQDGGKYRQIPVRITGARHECPWPDELPELLNDFYTEMHRRSAVCGMAESGVDAIGLACWAHAEFVRIHPFTDGNGRTCRLMMNYILMSNQCVPVSIPFEQKERYIQALEEYAQCGNLTPFINMVKELESSSLVTLICGEVQAERIAGLDNE